MIEDLLQGSLYDTKQCTIKEIHQITIDFKASKFDPPQNGSHLMTPVLREADHDDPGSPGGILQEIHHFHEFGLSTIAACHITKFHLPLKP